VHLAHNSFSSRFLFLSAKSIVRCLWRYSDLVDFSRALFALDSLKSILIFPFENGAVAGCMMVYTDGWVSVVVARERLYGRRVIQWPRPFLARLFALDRWRQRQHRIPRGVGWTESLGRLIARSVTKRGGMWFSVRYVGGQAKRQKMFRRANVSSWSSSSYLERIGAGV